MQKKKKTRSKFLSKLVLGCFRCLGLGLVAGCVGKCPKVSHLLLLHRNESEKVGSSSSTSKDAIAVIPSSKAKHFDPHPYFAFLLENHQSKPVRKGSIIKDNLRYSDPEKTILDFIYIWRYNGVSAEKIQLDLSECARSISREKTRRYSIHYPKTVQEIAKTLIKMRIDFVNEVARTHSVKRADLIEKDSSYTKYCRISLQTSF